MGSKLTDKEILLIKTSPLSDYELGIELKRHTQVIKNVREKHGLPSIKRTGSKHYTQHKQAQRKPKPKQGRPKYDVEFRIKVANTAGDVPTVAEQYKVSRQCVYAWRWQYATKPGVPVPMPKPSLPPTPQQELIAVFKRFNPELDWDGFRRSQRLIQLNRNVAAPQKHQHVV